MNRYAASLLIAASLLSGAVAAQEPAPAAAAAETTTAAVASASAWLALADAGKWSDAWSTMAPAVQAMVPKDSFAGSLEAAHAPLGAVQSRTLQSAVFTHTLPGAPAGDYVVIQYATIFANKTGAVETVVPMRTPDGSWKVSGYYVR